MRNLLLLLLITTGLYAQSDTLITPNGRYVFEKSYFPDSSTFIGIRAAPLTPGTVIEKPSCDNGGNVFSILEVTATGDNVEFLFDASGFSAGKWRIGSLSGLLNPTSNRIAIPLKLSAGTYTLEIEGESCNGKAFRKFAVAGIPPPTVTTPPKVIGSQSVDVFGKALPSVNNRIKAAGYSNSVDANSAYFLGQRDWKDVESNPTLGLIGYDYNPVIMERTSEPWTFGEWIQADYYSPGAVKVGPVYDRDVSSRLFEFDLKFPEFNLPSGKIVALDTETERSSDLMLKRGVTYAKNTTLLKSRVYFLGDHWLHQIGCPVAYTTSARDFQEWIINTPATTILHSFQRNIKPYSDYGYIMLNWEAVLFNVPDNQREKLTACLRWYNQQGFHAKLSAWTEAGLKTSRASFQGEFDINCYDGVTTFAGTESEFRSKFCKWGGSPDYARQLDVLNVGGYINYQIEAGVIHHYLLEYLVNKRYYPSKLVLATIWHDVEALGWKLSEVSKGNFTFHNKAAAFNQAMYNWGVWTVAVGDGFHMWSDPVKWTINLTDYPYAATDLNGNPLQGVAGKMYARSNMKNVDWLMRGVWEVSQHSDIINASTTWTIPTAPEKIFQDKSLLYAYKISSDGSEAMLLAHDAFHGEGVHNYTVMIQGKQLNITVDGTWTAVQRIKL